MTQSTYHEKYARKSDEDIAGRARIKEEELRRVFAVAPLQLTRQPVQVAVLGCGERRFVAHHQRIFKELLGAEIALTTFDIEVEHLQGEEGIVQHNIIQTLSGGPYDITYGHVVLKFIPTEQQWDAILASYEALVPGGLAIHVLNPEELESPVPVLPDGHFAVPIDRWRNALAERGISFIESDWIIPAPSLGEDIVGHALILRK
jgi:hypothetical protein